jgi:hypothetical protein
MRFREDNPADLERDPAGADEQLIDALGPQFHPDYGPVLRAMLFRFDEDHAGTAPERP